MRRSPLVSLLVFSFLGLSGCAGVSRRLDWSSPSTPRADADETPAPGRVSWWRRPRAEAPTSDSAGDLALFYRAGPSPIATKVPGDVWPEPKTNWQVRYFPHLSRLWNGNAPGNASDPEPISDVGHVSSRYRPPAASQSGRSDDDVRPVDASADDDIASRERSTVAEKRERCATACAIASARPIPNPFPARWDERRRARHIEGRPRPGTIGPIRGVGNPDESARVGLIVDDRVDAGRGNGFR